MPLVMIVEPEDSEADHFQRLFTKVALHWRQVRVKNGAAAIHHMVHTAFPDLLVTSMETPHMNAVDVAEWLRYIKCPKPVSVMIYDNSIAEDGREKLASLGVSHFLNKRSPEMSLKKSLMSQVTRIEVNFGSSSEELHADTVPAPPRVYRRYCE